MKTCLVEDGPQAVRMAARKILERFAFEIVEAADGCEALDRCIPRMPDAVLLDRNMPVMNGIEMRPFAADIIQPEFTHTGLL